VDSLHRLVSKGTVAAGALRREKRRQGVAAALHRHRKTAGIRRRLGFGKGMSPWTAAQLQREIVASHEAAPPDYLFRNIVAKDLQGEVQGDRIWNESF